MPSTIITKNGSGAPLAADLVAGELAVDLTNGRLYTEDTGGSVIEIGLNPSGNVDVTGTVTADGLTVDASTTTIQKTGDNPVLELKAHAGTQDAIAQIVAARSLTSGTNSQFYFKTNDGTSTLNRVGIADNGDISFYEDTGTTAKLFWDASAESLGIGTSSPSNALHISGVGGNESKIRISETDIGGNLDVLMSGGVGYSGTASNHPYVLITNDTERLRIDSSGNVGIGTTDPTVASGHGLAIYDATVPRVQLRNSTSGDTSSDGAGIFMSGSDLGIENRESSNIIFYNNTEKMRIDSAGNLLVGTVNAVPTSDAGVAIGGSGYVYATRDGDIPLLANRLTSDGDIAIFRKDGSTVGSIGSVSGGVELNSANGALYLNQGNTGGLVLLNSVGSGAPRIDPDTDDLVDLGEAASRFKDLYLSGDVIAGGTPSSSVVGVRINNSGSNFDLINTSCGSNTTAKTHVLFTNGNGNVGSIQTNGSATAYNTSSDYRLKENVVAISGATERLKQLKPSRFNFIADPDTTVDGFLAHEVQDIVPEAITGTKDAVDAEGNPEYQGIDQSKLVPLLVATIQELEARIAALEGAN